MDDILNDPVDFDIWVKVSVSEGGAVADWISMQQPVSKIDILKAILPAIKAGKYIRLYTGYGWLNLPQLCMDLPSFVLEGTAVITEQDCSPDYSVDYCEIHRLYHHRGLCPVCSDNYIHRGHRT